MKGDFALSFDIGIKNLAYCLIDVESQDIVLWKTFSIYAKDPCDQLRNLIKEMDDLILDFEKSDYYKKSKKVKKVDVVLELQPRRNVKMRVLSGQIKMYFVMAKYRNEFVDNKVRINKVISYSAKNKLKCYSVQEGDKPIVEKKYKSKYTFRKNLAIQHCERIISRANKNNNKYLDMFTKSKKKDDLSDSFLQGIAYILF